MQNLSQANTVHRLPAINTASKEDFMRVEKDPVVAIWGKMQRAYKKSNEAATIAEDALENLPKGATYARILCGKVDGKSRYAYSEEEIIEFMGKRADAYSFWGEEAKLKVLAQRDEILADFKAEKKRIKTIQDKAGYTPLKEREEAFTALYQSLDERLANSQAMTLEGIHCQVMRLYEYLSLDLEEPQDRLGEFVKSIKCALDKLVTQKAV